MCYEWQWGWIVWFNIDGIGSDGTGMSFQYARYIIGKGIDVRLVSEVIFKERVGIVIDVRPKWRGWHRGQGWVG
jgi:hypothetical protein